MLIAPVLLPILLALNQAGTPPPASVLDSEIRVASIGIGATRAAVVIQFGPELQETPESDPAFCGSEAAVAFRGVSAYFCDGILVNLECSTRRYRTPKGARVGMSESAIVSRYGEPERRDDDRGLRLMYRNATGERALIFHLAKGRVARIEVWNDFT